MNSNDFLTQKFQFLFKNVESGLSQCSGSRVIVAAVKEKYSSLIFSERRQILYAAEKIIDV